MLNRSRSRLFLTAFALVGAVALAAPTRAHADHEGVASFVSAAVGALFALPTIGVPGLVTAVHNGLYKNELTSGWRTAGYVFGALNLAAGVVLPTLGLRGSGCDGTCIGFNLAWSIPPLINGAVNLAFSALGKAPALDTRLGRMSVVPVTGVGAQNKVFGGVGLQLASF